MGIFDFWKRDKRLRLNEQILRLKQDFKDEIKDFEHFKELQVKKRDILRKIKKLWNKKWEEAEELVKTQIPDLIGKQLAFIKRDIGYVDDEDYILNYLIAVEERRNSILGHYISQNISQQHLSAIRNSINPKFIGELKETLVENSRILKVKLIQLKENIQKQSNFFNQSNPWSAINQDEEILKHLNKGDLLIQMIEHSMNHLMNNIEDIARYELGQSRQSLVSRRDVLRYAIGTVAGLSIETTPKLTSAQYKKPNVMVVISGNWAHTQGYFYNARAAVLDLWDPKKNNIYVGMGSLGAFSRYTTKEALRDHFPSSFATNLYAQKEINEAEDELIGLIGQQPNQPMPKLVYIGAEILPNYREEAFFGKTDRYFITPSKSTRDWSIDPTLEQRWKNYKGIKWFTADTKDEIKARLEYIINK